MKILSVSINIILFLFVITAAYNLLFSITTIYNIEWYSLHFENDVIGLFMGSFFGYRLCFYCVLRVYGTYCLYLDYVAWRSRQQSCTLLLTQQ